MAGLVVLLLAVAASTGAGRGAGASGFGGGAVPHWMEFCTLVVAGAVGTFALAFSLATHWRGRRHRLVYTPMAWWQKVVLCLVGMMWLAGAVVACEALARAAKALGAFLAHAHAPRSLGNSQSLVSGAALVVGLVIALAVMAGGAIGWRAGPQPLGPSARAPTGPGPDARPVTTPLSLAALRAEPDPRRAVIGAYAHMELCLAEVGLARQPHEAPFEHMDRVEQRLGAAAGPGRALAGLFEWARFAHHPCGLEMKRSALSALMVVQEMVVQDMVVQDHMQPAGAGGPLQA